MTEPVFSLREDDDPEMELAHSMAAATMPEFLRWVRAGDSSVCLAKLRFRDPDFSEEMGEDQYFFLWLSSVVHHPEDNILSGVFFEVPEGFDKWHSVGSRLGFDAEDVFDWLVLTDGHARGGYRLRLARSRLDAEERAQFDAHVGISSYEPISNETGHGAWP